MRRLKHTMMLIVTALGCAALVSAKPGGSRATDQEPDQKTIRFTLVDDLEEKSPKPNATIFFAFYDREKSEWQRSSQQTDSAGKCSFLVPSGDDGESYTFLFATAQDELDKAIRDASVGRRLGWRIPPGEQEDLELLTDGTSQSNTKGAVQMWGIR
jgi:hypothetical protein